MLSSIIDSHAALGALGRFKGLGSNPKPANPKKYIIFLFYDTNVNIKLKKIVNKKTYSSL